MRLAYLTVIACSRIISEFDPLEAYLFDLNFEEHGFDPIEMEIFY
jgi:hypothetical protein